MHYVRHRLVPADELPYAYFQALRLVVCGAGCLCAATLRKLPFWLWAMAITAILFNPFIPARFSRSTWQVIDVIAGVIFLCAVFPIWRSRMSGPKYGQEQQKGP